MHLLSMLTLMCAEYLYLMERADWTRVGVVQDDVRQQLASSLHTLDRAELRVEDSLSAWLMHLELEDYMEDLAAIGITELGQVCQLEASDMDVVGVQLPGKDDPRVCMGSC